MPVWAQAPSDDAAGEPVFEIDIPAGNAADALNRLAEQTGAILLFPYDLAEARQANAVVGRYTLLQALSALLKDSGLSGGLSDRRVIQIVVDEMSTTTNETSTGGEQAMNATKKAGLLAIIVGALSGGVNAQDRTAAEQEIQTTVVTGSVTDARTGANLKGARVTIEETGQWTSTDDLGQFRFPAAPIGEYTLRASFLGYEEVAEAVVVNQEGGRQDLKMRSLFDEIVVLGARSGRMQALNQERTAPVTSTVLNADQLGAFNGTTISEVLRRAPGVAFIPDPETGDGANVIIRGLEPDLNQVQLNGVRLLDGSGIGRSPDLSNILTESIESVTISKSLLPSQDSNGTGGLVEIETKSPLDRDRRFAIFGAEYGESGGDFGDEFLINATVSGIFGENQDFGASLSVAYREREVTRINYTLDELAFGEFMPAGVTNRSADIDPRTPFPFADAGTDVYPGGSTATEGSTEDEIVSVTAAIQRQFGSHTDLRLDVTVNQQTQSTYNSSTVVGTDATYGLVALDEFGGEERLILTAEDPFIGTSLEFFGVTGIPADVQRQVAFTPNRENTDVGISFRGETALDAWDFDYSVGYTRSENQTPEDYSLQLLGQAPVRSGGLFFTLPAIERDFLTPEILANTQDQRLISIYRPLQPNNQGVFILPGFSREAFDFYNDLDSLLLERIQTSPPSSGESDALTLSGGVRRSFDNDWLRYLEAGFNYQDTTFSSTFGIGERVFREPAAGVALTDLGLAFGPGILERVGAVGDFAALNRGSFESVIGRLAELESQGLLEIAQRDEFDNANTFFEGTNDTNEETMAVYLEGQVDVGKLEIIGGVRIEHLELTSTFFTGPTVRDENGLAVPGFTEEFGQFVTDTISQTDALPRVITNYRFTDNMIVRGAYYMTVSRPQLQNLTQRQRLGLSLRTTVAIPEPTLSVTQGNPDLKPATTHNLGLDFEYYTGDVGVLKAGLFYKVTENPLQLNRTEGGLEIVPEDLVIPDIPFFDDLPDNLFVQVSQPVNGDDELSIWGIDLAVERQFTFLPGAWSGMGVYANYAYTDSERDVRRPFGGVPEGFVILEGVPFAGAPEYSGTAGFTYSGSGIDASLLYSIQDRRLASFGSNFINTYDEEIDSLDFRLDYFREFNGLTMRFFLRGNDLLKSKEDPALETSVGGERALPRYFTGGTYFGGRSIFVGVSVAGGS